MKKSTNSLYILLISFSYFLGGCVPPLAMEKAENRVLIAESASIENTLATTTAGNETIKVISNLKAAGYTVDYIATDESSLLAQNGHSGGGYKINGNNISIYMNKDLTVKNQAHVVAHEIVHISDDLEIQKYLRTYPYIDSAAQNFVATYKSKPLESFDTRVVSYVLNTLFCAEARAYTQNQRISDQGLTSTEFAKGDRLGQFIDVSYINKFGTSFGSNAEAMNSWCLKQSNMTQVQSQISW